MNDTVEQKRIKSPGYNALVVDDDSASRLLLQKYLEKCGVSVTSVDNGLTATRQFERMHFDIVFMDLDMPQMGGLQATSVMRDLESKLLIDPTPIIAVTAGGASRSTCMAVGMSDYIEKPVSLVQLDQIRKKWMTKTCC